MSTTIDIPHNALVCPKCHGDGSEDLIEDRRPVVHACYKCGTSGWVTPDQYRDHQLNAYCEHLAYRIEVKVRDEVNADPEGDGYSLGAGESGLSDADYLRENAWRRVDEVRRELEPLSGRLLDALMEGFTRPPQRFHDLLRARREANRQAREEAERLSTPADGEAFSPDDIPF